MPTQLVARLNKDQIAIHCGRPECGHRFPNVSYFPMGGDESYVRLAAGWITDARGVWTLSNYAARRHEETHRAASGNPGTSPTVALQARARLHEGRSVKNRRPIKQPPLITPGDPDDVDDLLNDPMFDNLRATELAPSEHLAPVPVEIRCPDCHGTSRFEPSER